MPKSKSKRGKTYRPRPVKVGPYVTAEFLSGIKGKVDNVLLLIETTLPAGNCTNSNMQAIEDLFNSGAGIIHRRRKNLDSEELAQCIPVISRGYKALGAIAHRHQSGTSAGYVCTGDELRAIRETVDIIGPMIKEALELSANQTIDEFEWAKGVATQRYKEKLKKENQHE